MSRGGDEPPCQGINAYRVLVSLGRTQIQNKSDATHTNEWADGQVRNRGIRERGAKYWREEVGGKVTCGLGAGRAEMGRGNDSRGSGICTGSGRYSFHKRRNSWGSKDRETAGGQNIKESGRQEHWLKWEGPKERGGPRPGTEGTCERSRFTSTEVGQGCA